MIPPRRSQQTMHHKSHTRVQRNRCNAQCTHTYTNTYTHAHIKAESEREAVLLLIPLFCFVLFLSLLSSSLWWSRPERLHIIIFIENWLFKFVLTSSSWTCFRMRLDIDFAAYQYVLMCKNVSDISIYTRMYLIMYAHMYVWMHVCVIYVSHLCVCMSL